MDDLLTVCIWNTNVCDGADTTDINHGLVMGALVTVCTWKTCACMVEA